MSKFLSASVASAWLVAISVFTAPAGAAPQ